MKKEKLKIKNYRSVAKQRKPKLFTIYPKGTCHFVRAHYSLFTHLQREVH